MESRGESSSVIMTRSKRQLRNPEVENMETPQASSCLTTKSFYGVPKEVPKKSAQPKESNQPKLNVKRKESKKRNSRNVSRSKKPIHTGVKHGVRKPTKSMTKKKPLVPFDKYLAKIKPTLKKTSETQTKPDTLAEPTATPKRTGPTNTPKRKLFNADTILLPEVAEESEEEEEKGGQEQMYITPKRQNIDCRTTPPPEKAFAILADNLMKRQNIDSRTTPPPETANPADDLIDDFTLKYPSDDEPENASKESKESKESK